MPNYGYQKGCRLERQLVNEARRRGEWAIRSAGSHSPIDVVRVTGLGTIVEFIQVKANKTTSCKMPKFQPVMKSRRLLAYKRAGKWIFVEVD